MSFDIIIIVFLVLMKIVDRKDIQFSANSQIKCYQNFS